MPRPKKLRWISGHPGVSYFKPQGVPLRFLSQVRLEVDELEALKLADLEGLSQEEAADQMNVSRATFGRIVEEARRKVADALVHGKAIQIEGGEVTLHPDFMPGQGFRHHGRGRRHGW
ncbi:DUF134 domain-containing protein [bacterium]|nr:DUF134 domain-containing protein [bacterium]